MPTNAQVIGEGLLNFDEYEYEVREVLADYVECPSDPDCSWDGKTEHLSICTECKLRWLEKEWEG